MMKPPVRQGFSLGGRTPSCWGDNIKTDMRSSHTGWIRGVYYRAPAEDTARPKL